MHVLGAGGVTQLAVLGKWQWHEEGQGAHLSGSVGAVVEEHTPTPISNEKIKMQGISKLLQVQITNLK